MHVRTRDHLGVRVGPLSPVEMGSGIMFQRLIVLSLEVPLLYRGSKYSMYSVRTISFEGRVCSICTQVCGKISPQIILDALKSHLNAD